jgi:methyl-accepting chemotaxis protein
MASTAEELSSQALQLQDTVSYFRLDAMNRRPSAPKALASGRKSSRPVVRPARPASVKVDLHKDADDSDFERF